MKCKYLDLGCFGHCDHIVLPILANKTDMYQLEYQFLNHIDRKRIPLSEGESVVLDGAWFNETAEVVVKVFDGDGDALTICELDITGQMCNSYDEFKIKFSPRVSLDRPLSSTCYCV